MNYFQVINESMVRSSDTSLKIETMGDLEGHVLRQVSEGTTKIASFELEYDIKKGQGVRFVFGSSTLRERLVEIPLPDEREGPFRFKINLKNKLITGDTHQAIDINMRTIKWFGFLLKNSVIEVAIPKIELAIKHESDAPPKTEVNSPLVCLLTKNSESDIEEYLKKIEKSFSKNWGLIIADINSKDSTYDIIKSHDSSAGFYHYFQFNSDVSVEDANARLKEFTKSLEGTYEHVIYKEMVAEESKHIIQSFCTVATDNLKIETSILIKSLREYHDDPVYIVCDSGTKKFLEIEGFDNLYFNTVLSKSELNRIKKKLFSDKFTSTNLYHKPAWILQKMVAMNFALEQHENTFFLDTDIIVLDSLQENFQKDIVLSPHFYKNDKVENSFKYGFFNAGYIFCANKSFPDYWKDIYLNNSTFFEQEGMNHIIEDYSIQTFSESHNFGFWRSGKPPERLKVFMST